MEPGDFRITATDISPQVLSKAQSGEYTENEVARGLSSNQLTRHFSKTPEGWKVNSEVMELVQFRQTNLTQNFIHLGGFDVIFCRNVLIYFEENSKKKIINQMHQMLAPGGLLLLGSAESLYCLNEQFESVRFGSSVFYRKA